MQVLFIILATLSFKLFQNKSLKWLLGHNDMLNIQCHPINIILPYLFKNMSETIDNLVILTIHISSIYDK